MTNFFDNQRIANCFKRKKDDAKRRGIECSLTKDQYIQMFEFLKQFPTCIYTGRPFNFSETNHDDYPTLERVDSSKGYELSNVIWIGLGVNLIKGALENSEAEKTTVYLNKLELIHAASAVLLDNTKAIEAAKQLEHFVINNSESKGENNMSDSKSVEQNEILEPKTKLTDIDIANKYINIHKIMTGKGYVFELSFNDYKKVVSRKQCQLSGAKFDNQDQQSIFVINKELPINIDNVLTVTKDLRNTLDTFLKDAKLSTSDAISMFEKLGKLTK